MQLFIVNENHSQNQLDFELFLGLTLRSALGAAAPRLRPLRVSLRGFASARPTCAYL